MTAETDAVVAVRIPQININDEEVRLVGWKAAAGDRVREGEPICEVETSKAVGDVPSPAIGVFRPTAPLGEMIRIGEVVGYIGPSAEVIASYLSSLATLPAAGQPAAHHEPNVSRIAAASVSTMDATAGAIEMAQREGVDLAKVIALDGGRIRRVDVERYLAERPPAQFEPSAAATPRTNVPSASLQAAGEPLPTLLMSAVENAGNLPEHQWSAAQHLARTQAGMIVAHTMMDVVMTPAMEWVREQRAQGRMASPLPILIKATVAAIAACPKLAMFRTGRQAFRYRAVDIAFTARSHDDMLFTPVVRAADKLNLSEIAARCSTLAMAAFRGRIDAKDLTGGCITVSLLNEQPVRMHVGLQNTYQSAILTAGAVRDEVRLLNGQPAAVPVMTLTLSYDHGLMDGWDAAVALDAARVAIEDLRF